MDMLERRIARLERANRILMGLCLLPTAAVFAAAWGPQQKVQAKTNAQLMQIEPVIRANKILLYDPETRKMGAELTWKEFSLTNQSQYTRIFPGWLWACQQGSHKGAYMNAGSQSGGKGPSFDLGLPGGSFWGRLYMKDDNSAHVRLLGSDAKEKVVLPPAP